MGGGRVWVGEGGKILGEGMGEGEGVRENGGEREVWGKRRLGKRQE